MENIEIATRLEELADLLEIKGSNPFRIRAYRNAIRLIRGLTRPLAEMVANGEDLEELPGIGEDLSGQIHELLDTGGMELLEEVAKEVPRELAVLTKIEGVGPKKAKKLWKELGVTSVDRLEAAVRDGRVAELEGFGKKSAEKILQAIEGFRKHQGRFLRGEAGEVLRPLLDHMEKAKGVTRLDVAGSFRRGVETVGDIDLLAVLQAHENAGAARWVMDHFTGYAGVERVEASGETRGRVVLRSGLPVDLRVLSEENHGAALHHFTGSKEHNVQIRTIARERGLRVSEYGVFRLESRDGKGAAKRESKGVEDEARAPEGERICGATEEEVFEAVGLPWIPPVLREGRGEIEAAREGRLPQLVQLSDIRGDLHMHSTWSDGRDSIEAMLRACRERGYQYMAITDHSQAVTVANGLTPERLREQAAEVAVVREAVEGIVVFHGCEVDILKDGSLDLPDESLDLLDIVLVAVHSHFHLDPAAQAERVLKALAHPAVDVLVHPTGRLLGRREPYGMDVEAVLEGAREHDVAVELNANPRRLDLHDRHLFRARELGLLVSVGTDAHRTDTLGQIEPALLQAQRGWLEPRDVLNAKPLEELRRWLSRGESNSRGNST
ncbi:MAG: DNA polymerase/3'-5' exonuclease PolX [Gemmatimonadota bacterium]